MTKICLLAVWMGKLPDTFELWKQSVLQNTTVDFYVITDNAGQKDERNLKFIYMTLAEVKQKFQAILDFPIFLETPYKICDYKPLFGEAFRDITSQYEFWGHIDIDLILGDIRSFLTDELLGQYDKLFEAGCFILYRNTEEMRNLYKRSMNKDNMAYPYRKAFRCRYACYFDEYMGMNILDWEYKIRVFRDQDKETMVQDFGWQRLEFCSYIVEESFVFYWEKGKLYRYQCDETGRILQIPPKELLLVHIQKRKMDIAFSKEAFLKQKSMWIVPNRFQLEMPQQALYTEDEKERYQRKIKKSDLQRSLHNLKQFGVIQYIPHFFRSRRIRSWIVKKKGFF